MTRELVDCHTHTCFSDGTPSIEDNVARASALGLTTIACTDHFVLPASIDPDCACSVPAKDVQDYFSAIEAARAAHPEIDVVCGWECDFYDGCEAFIERYRGPATFLLGSVHALDGSWIDDLSDLAYWDSHPLEDVWRRYFEVWCEACFCPVGFSSMAHPDLVQILGLFPSDLDLRLKLYDKAAAAAHDAHVCIEVSSAGLRKPVGKFYPDAHLLQAFHHAEVPITVGSDAHDVSIVGNSIGDLYAYAYEAGYRSVRVPTSSGGWREISL